MKLIILAWFIGVGLVFLLMINGIEYTYQEWYKNQPLERQELIQQQIKDWDEGLN